MCILSLACLSALSHAPLVLLYIIKWVVRALNADWLTAMVYQTVYHGYDKTFIFTALDAVYVRKLLVI